MADVLIPSPYGPRPRFEVIGPPIQHPDGTSHILSVATTTVTLRSSGSVMSLIPKPSYEPMADLEFSSMTDSQHMSPWKRRNSVMRTTLFFVVCLLTHPISFNHVASRCLDLRRLPTEREWKICTE